MHQICIWDSSKNIKEFTGGGGNSADNVNTVSAIDSEEEMIQRAMAMSLTQVEQSAFMERDPEKEEETETEEEMIHRAMAMSLAQEEASLSGGREAENENDVDTEEKMLQRAIAMSLEQEERRY